MTCCFAPCNYGAVHFGRVNLSLRHTTECIAVYFGRGDDTVGNPHRAQISQFELFELILLLKLDKQFPVEQFEATVSQSTVPSPLLSIALNGLFGSLVRRLAGSPASFARRPFLSARNATVEMGTRDGFMSRKGTNGVSTNGVTTNFMFFDRGTSWVLPLTYFYVPRSARAYLFPKSVNSLRLQRPY